MAAENAQIMPGLLPGLGHIRDERQWRRYLQAQYGRYWKVHFAKKTRGAWHSVKYLGRYLKRAPVSAPPPAFCQRSGRNAGDGITVGKAA
ncbi:transposase family protein, partial [Candidatus Erwinia dacicola]